MTGAGETLPTAPDQKSQAPGTVVDLPPQGSQANPPATASSSETNPASSGGTSAAAPDDNGGEEKTQEAKATPPEVPAKPAKAKAKAPKPAAPAAATSPDAELELAGERYLYGNGLPQNCTRAEFNLRTAATHGNTKAQTVLGTMYATGHCVGRDLPTAYRWFARALHQEPNNSRISDDLQVLWRQMTAQERQLATAAGQ
jgi:TPR repeat protein